MAANLILTLRLVLLYFLAPHKSIGRIASVGPKGRGVQA
jgi:hypothetical protein